MIYWREESKAAGITQPRLLFFNKFPSLFTVEYNCLSSLGARGCHSQAIHRSPPPLCAAPRAQGRQPGSGLTRHPSAGLRGWISGQGAATGCAGTSCPCRSPQKALASPSVTEHPRHARLAWPAVHQCRDVRLQGEGEAEKRGFAISLCPGLKEKLLPLWKILSGEPHGGRKQRSVQAHDSPVAEKFLLFSCYTGVTSSAGRASALHQSCVWVMLSKLQHWWEKQVRNIMERGRIPPPI